MRQIITRKIEAGLVIQPHSLIAYGAEAVTSVQTVDSTLFILVIRAGNVEKCMQPKHTVTEALRLPVPRHQESVVMSPSWCLLHPL